MKFIAVFIKSLKEQIRNFWILVLTVSLAPFFVFIYYLMMGTGVTNYDIGFVNYDRGQEGEKVIELVDDYSLSEDGSKLRAKTYETREIGIKQLEKKKIDALVVIPDDFSKSILEKENQKFTHASRVEFVGDVTNMTYMVAALWTEEIMKLFVSEGSGVFLPMEVYETTLGTSGSRSEFDFYVPGMLIFAIIMILFTASATIVMESENQTITRLKLSKLRAFDFVGGISVVQFIISFISLVLTLMVAMALGFKVEGSVGLIILVVFVATISILGISLIVAGFSNSIRDVLTIGNFPLFLLMFFTGAAFQFDTGTLFSIGEIAIKTNYILSPTHAVNALNKILILNQGFSEILPELFWMIALSILYFIVGFWMYKRKHLSAV